MIEHENQRLTESHQQDSDQRSLSDKRPAMKSMFDDIYRWDGVGEECQVVYVAVPKCQVASAQMAREQLDKSGQAMPAL